MPRRSSRARTRRDERARRDTNFRIHVASLAATKTGDGLVDPKLVLSWILASLGAPATAIAMLVPVRESLALLLQLVISGTIGRLAKRKWVWAAGSAIQGLCSLGMAAAALTLDGATAGWTIVALLAIFATARCACSVSYKDVLGKTVETGSRGTATGMAASIAATAVFAYGALISLGILPLTVTVLGIGLVTGGGLWLIAASAFTRLDEPASEPDGGENGWAATVGQLALIARDPQLARFTIARGLLTATALAPPFVVGATSAGSQGELAHLGPLVIASSSAAILSGYIWGRLSDRSSRIVLFAAAIGGAIALASSAVLAFAHVTSPTAAVVGPIVLFALMVCYHGVRLGRSTHLVDMAPEDDRASYTAVSNTIIGLVILAGGVFGIVGEVAGVGVVLAMFSGMCGLAAVVAYGLDEVQHPDADP